jgi:3-hydroxyisobutyrate dehydrogenase-like beta-hydroxyacid dehydrogenase
MVCGTRLFARIEPLLRYIGRRHALRRTGCGQVVKLINNAGLQHTMALAE